MRWTYCSLLICAVGLIASSCASRQRFHGVPIAEPIWSVVLDPDASEISNTGSVFESTRRVVIVGDRVVALVEGVNRYRLFSLKLDSGAIAATQNLSGNHTPLLYATDDDHIIVGVLSLERLHPDLTSSGERFREDAHGGTTNISPDGTTLAHETTPGTELLSSHTFLPVGTHITESAPRSVSAKAILTDNIYWYGAYPKDQAFVTFNDGSHERLLYHGRCSGGSSFLSNDRVLVVGCGEFLILDTAGNTLKRAPVPFPHGEFAGVSRDGLRFAIRGSEWTEWHKLFGEPEGIRSEAHIVFRSDTGEPLAATMTGSLPDQASWSALSKDGRYFVSGGPKRLRLFRVP